MIIVIITGEMLWLAFLSFRTNSFARDTDGHRAMAPRSPLGHEVGSQAQCCGP